MDEKGKATSVGGEANENEEEPLFSDQASLIGLRLTKSPSFVNFLQTNLSQTGKTNPLSHGDGESPLMWERNSSPESSQPKRKIDDFMSQPMSEKLKASNFPAIVLRIGFFERVSRHESDLVAKLYYAKRKLVWEFLEGPLKKKIEIQWSDIGAMRATIEDGQPGIWEIELNQPPLFFHETNPQPRKHTLWQPVGDFTNGQASHFRRHFVKFPRGVLDKHYEKLLQCDPRLHTLSLKPFPSQNPTIFYQPTSYEVSDLCLDFQRHATPSLILRQPQQYPPSFPSHMITHNNWLLQTSMLAPNTNNNVVHVFGNNETQSSLSDVPISQPNNSVFPSHEYHVSNQSATTFFNHLEDHLLADHDQDPTYDETIMLATANSLLGDQSVNPNMEALSFYGFNLENVSHGQVMESHVTQGSDLGGTLYHGSTWAPSENTKGDHSSCSCSTSNSASPPGSYPNQDLTQETQEWA